MTGSSQELGAYRISQARDSLREADVLLREEMSLRSVMNRLRLLAERFVDKAESVVLEK